MIVNMIYVFLNQLYYHKINKYYRITHEYKLKKKKITHLFQVLANYFFNIYINNRKRFNYDIRRCEITF